MKLIQRVSYILTANLNDLVDRCEDPEKMLRQAVREMESAFGQLLEAAAQAIAHNRTLTRQLNEQQAFAERHQRSAAAAVTRGDDDAARRELRCKSDCEQLAARLETQQQSAAALAERLRRQVGSLRIKLAEARQKLFEVTARSRATIARRNFVHGVNSAAYQRAAANFDRLVAQVDHREDETEALLELIGESDDLIQCDNHIEAELTALKEAALQENTHHAATA